MAKGKSTALAWKEAGAVEQTYYTWRKERGGLGMYAAAISLPRCLCES